MIFNQSDSTESKTTEALVPMVDLFAVLAIVFMIYSSDEITASQQLSQEKIDQVVSDYKLLQDEIDTTEKARQERREFLANNADKSLEEIEAEREKKSQELIKQFTEMLAAQQNQAALEYENLVTRVEIEHEQEVEREKAELEAEKQLALEMQVAQLSTELAETITELEQEKEVEISLAKQEFDQTISAKEAQLETSVQALVEAEKQRLEELARQEVELEEQKRQEVARVEQQRLEQETLAAREAEKQRSDTELALAKAEQTRINQLKQASRVRAKALAKAGQARTDALARQRAELEAQKLEQAAETQAQHVAALRTQQAQAEEEKQQAVERVNQVAQTSLALLEAETAERAQAQQAQAEAQLAQELAAAEAAAKAAAQVAAETARKQAEAEAEQALANELASLQAKSDAQLAQELAAAAAAAAAAAEAADKTAEQRAKVAVEQEHAAQLARLEAEKDKALQPYREAEKARQQIVDRLNENFKDFNTGVVVIDEKTGKVRINFQESYFVRGSYELSENMKDLLRVMIPKYAKSIYENKDAAVQIESLKISGMTSPVHKGVYIDINGTSPETEIAREFNMVLSNNRALVMYNFIFDEDEMGDYEYRARLKADMGIAALGFQTATPVSSELVGKRAKCIKYDCKQEQASILEFRLYSEN